MNGFNIPSFLCKHKKTRYTTIWSLYSFYFVTKDLCLFNTRSVHITYYHTVIFDHIVVIQCNMVSHYCLTLDYTMAWHYCGISLCSGTLLYCGASPCYGTLLYCSASLHCDPLTILWHVTILWCLTILWHFITTMALYCTVVPHYPVTLSPYYNTSLFCSPPTILWHHTILWFSHHTMTPHYTIVPPGSHTV